MFTLIKDWLLVKIACATKKTENHFEIFYQFIKKLKL